MLTTSCFALLAAQERAAIPMQSSTLASHSFIFNTLKTQIQEKCAKTLELPLLIRRLVYSFCYVSTGGWVCGVSPHVAEKGNSNVLAHSLLFELLPYYRNQSENPRKCCSVGSRTSSTLLKHKPWLQFRLWCNSSSQVDIYPLNLTRSLCIWTFWLFTSSPCMLAQVNRRISKRFIVAGVERGAGERSLIHQNSGISRKLGEFLSEDYGIESYQERDSPEE